MRFGSECRCTAGWEEMCAEDEGASGERVSWIPGEWQTNGKGGRTEIRGSRVVEGFGYCRER